LKSKRKYSRILFERIKCDSRYSKIFQHFKDGIENLEFFFCNLYSLALADTLAAGVEELRFTCCHFRRAAKCHADFSKFRKIKLITVRNEDNIEIVNYLPQTEKLEVRVDRFDSKACNHLKQYMERQEDPITFTIEIR
jgi:hypothetical protein